jgi:hypothetical protein
MPVAAFALPVDAPSELLWQLLADSAAVPQRYDHSVESVRIVERDEASLVREVVRRGRMWRERITLDTKRQSLTAELIDDSAYTGKVELRAEAANPSSSGHNTPRISARMDWLARSGSEDNATADALSRELEQQLLDLKHAAEARAAQIAAA